MKRHKRMCRKEVEKIGRKEGKVKGWNEGIRHKPGWEARKRKRMK